MKLKFKGEPNDTYRANAYVLKCMLISFAVLLFCWILDLFGIFIVDLKIMTIAVIGASVCCILAVLYAYIVGLDKPASRYVIMLLIVSMATVICTELTYHTVMFMIFPLICSEQYFDKRLSTFTAITICIGYTIAVMVGYEIGLCDTNMVLLSYTDSATHAAALQAGDFTINSNRTLMFLYFVFPRWLIVLVMLPLLNHIARDIQARTSREAMSRHLAETDGLTGIYNRNKFLQSISTHYTTCRKVAVIYFDLNNLKTINDTKGHEYGDILICEMANILRGLETADCKSYRIGGDEFVTILENDGCKRAEEITNMIKNDVQGKICDGNIRLSVAVGFAEGAGKNVEKIVTEADEDMYRRKAVMKAGEEKIRILYE